MAEVKPADKKVKLRNKTKSVIVSGPIRIMPGAEIEIFESKISPPLPVVDRTTSPAPSAGSVAMS